VIHDFVTKSHTLKLFDKAVSAGKDLLVEGLWDSPKAILASIAKQASGKNIFIVTGRAKEKNLLFEDFSLFHEGEVYDFPAWETLPTENVPPSPDIVGERYTILRALLESKEQNIIISNVQACLQRLITPEAFLPLCSTVHVGDSLPFDDFLKKLDAMGYQHKTVASDKGEYAVRGGIIDVFPVNTPEPFRIEFWGDEVSSMRLYDPVGQKSIQKAEVLDITPAQELELLGEEEEKLSSILDYLGDDTIIIFDDVVAVENRYVTLDEMHGGTSPRFMTFYEFYDSLSSHQKIFFSEYDVEEISDVRVLKRDMQASSDKAYSYFISFQVFDRDVTAKRFLHPFRYVRDHICPVEHAFGEDNNGGILKSLGTYKDDTLQVHFLSSTKSDEQHLKKMLREADIKKTKNMHFHEGYLSSGFVLRDTNEAVIPFTEITHRHKIRRKKMRGTFHTMPSEIFDIVPGDHVVHLNAGIGKFTGIERQKNHNDIESEFFVIEYADNARLYLPFSQAHLISKYIGTHDNKPPKIHALGGKRWKKAKEQTEHAILGYASELLHLYAERSVHEGLVYPSDSDDVVEFERDFPYVETADQVQAVQEIKSDMMSENAMERLVCGDVGYGKTEVAMRAAFKAVVDGGKQVAILVPTTVLAMQHFDTFVERMWNYPVRIGVLSRFNSQKEIKATLKGVQEGSVDILIGTHRIISGDIAFKDLGLVVVDEEHRFGVKAKEYLKSIKKTVDYLVLSATPIPRTLYMSLLGARDMSVINTPPQDRLPIKTIICEVDNNVIKNALLRELNRDGQVYVIHNRVETIYNIVDKIRALVPQASVMVAHGQMASDEIDTVFHAFKKGEIDVLVATTIIENGIDIPNANTIIIDRADHFGLGDLYQLRGRVGRWNRRAYAYFLTPKKQVLPPVTRKRMEALVESGGGYGGGMKIAMRDLEIRGAGNILGTDQSGHVSSIGFHLYCKLLKRTVGILQGKLPSTICDTKMEFSHNAGLPEHYINATSLRLEIYQRLGEAISYDDVDNIVSEVKDRFGKLPEEAEWLFHLTRVRVFCSLNHITTLKLKATSFFAEGVEKGCQKTKTCVIPKRKKAKEFEKELIKKLKEAFAIGK
jgi:transcription-repair coupling factor (superfamily II helicase)